MRSDLQVHAWCDDGVCTVECTACGPLGVVASASLDHLAVNHMTQVHGAEVVAR